MCQRDRKHLSNLNKRLLSKFKPNAYLGLFDTKARSIKTKPCGWAEMKRELLPACTRALQKPQGWAVVLLSVPFMVSNVMQVWGGRAKWGVSLLGNAGRETGTHGGKWVKHFQGTKRDIFTGLGQAKSSCFTPNKNLTWKFKEFLLSPLFEGAK